MIAKQLQECGILPPDMVEKFCSVPDLFQKLLGPAAVSDHHESGVGYIQAQGYSGLLHFEDLRADQIKINPWMNFVANIRVVAYE